MINEKTPQIREAIVANIEKQKLEFLAAGNSIQTVNDGLSSVDTLCNFNNQQKRHQADRAKLAPELRAQANNGRSLQAAALAMKIKYARARLIAKENGIVFIAT